jgi:glycerophosphoryl diester phosphodiesterase
MLYDISDPDLALQWADKGAELIETRDIGTMLQHPLLQQRRCR